MDTSLWSVEKGVQFPVIVLDGIANVWPPGFNLLFMFRLWWRAVFFGVYTSRIVLEILLRKWLSKRFELRDAMRVRKRWAQRLMYGVGVRVQSEGAVPDFPCLLVCNHRSYLDPIIILREVDGFPVSKAEVEHWPVLGYGAKLAGILYLHREDSGSRVATFKAMASVLQGGFPIIIFPEGTTSGLPGTLPFKKGAFQIAARFGFPVVPAAIEFEDERDYWVGSESFGAHAGRRFRDKEIRVRLRYGPAFRSSDHEELLEKSRHWIEAALASFRSETD